MVLVLDNYDSFTYNLIDYLTQLGINCRIFKNTDNIDEITSQNYTAVVISPGPEIPTKAGNLNQVLHYYVQRLPILGVCLGHQAIGEYFGMELIKAEAPRHGKLIDIKPSPHWLFKDLPENFNVVQYNSLILKADTNEELEIIAYSSLGHIMAINHKVLPITGIQFHPEAVLTEFGMEILKNWVEYHDL